MRAQLYDFLGEMRKALPDGHGSGDGSTTDEQAKLAAILYYNQLQGLHRRPDGLRGRDREGLARVGRWAGNRGGASGRAPSLPRDSPGTWPAPGSHTST